MSSPSLYYDRSKSQGVHGEVCNDFIADKHLDNTSERIPYGTHAALQSQSLEHG